MPGRIFIKLERVEGSFEISFCVHSIRIITKFWVIPIMNYQPGSWLHKYKQLLHVFVTICLIAAICTLLTDLTEATFCKTSVDVIFALSVNKIIDSAVTDYYSSQLCVLYCQLIRLCLSCVVLLIFHRLYLDSECKSSCYNSVKCILLLRLCSFIFYFLPLYVCQLNFGFLCFPSLANQLIS